MRPAIAAMTPPNPRHRTVPHPGRPKGLNVLGTFAHHPELAHAFWTFNGHLLRATTLTERHREMLILRVASLTKSSYEWTQHLILGRDAGLTETEIGWIAWGSDAPSWTTEDSAILKIAEDLIADHIIGDKTWETLTELLDTQQILDAIYTIGAYQTIAWMMLSFGVELDDDLKAWRYDA